MSKADDNRLHFWVGAIFTGLGVFGVVALQDQKMTTALQAVLVVGIVLGVVLMVRYPLHKKA